MRRSRRGGPLARLLLTVAVLVGAGLVTTGPASAHQFYPDVYVPWPFDTVTYRAFGSERDDPANQRALDTAVAAFNRANERYAQSESLPSYYRLVPLASGRPNVRFIFDTPGGREQDRDPCAGVAWPGWYFDGTDVIVEADDRCDVYARTLLVAHEIGHVFLLEDTTRIDEDEHPERVECSALNFNRLRRGMPPRLRYLTRPNGNAWLTQECPGPRRTSSGRWTGREYWRAPFQRDDQVGFSRISGSDGFDFLPFRFPPEVCQSSNSEYVRTFTLCQFEYDCRGAAARNDTAPSSPSVSTRTDSNGKYPWLRNCQERPYSTADRQQKAASPLQRDAWLDQLGAGGFTALGPSRP